MKQAGPFDPRVVYGLIALGIAAFAVLIWVMAYGGPVRQAREVSRAQMMSPSAVGFKGLVELAGAVGQAYRVDSPQDLDYEDLLVLAVDENGSREELSWVRQRRQARATLFILPKWRTIPSRRRDQWVTATGTGAGDRIAAALGYRLRIAFGTRPGARAAGEEMLDGLGMAAPQYPQVIEGAGLVPLLTLPDGGGTLLARIEGRPHYILADPDLINNHGLRDPVRAQAALDLLDALNATDAQSVNFATFTDVVAARETRGLLRLVIEPPFLAMTLALVIAALLAGLHGAVRFGQARREQRAIALGKAALVENSAGLIRLAGREHRMGLAYTEYIRQEAARAAGAPLGLQGAALDAHLDRLTRSGPDFTTLASNLATARDRQAMVAAARALFQWKKDIIR